MKVTRPYRLAFAAAIGVPLLFVGMAPPLVLGGYCIAVYAMLIVGLFQQSLASPRLAEVFGWWTLTCVLVLMIGSALYQVASALVDDESADRYVDCVLLAVWVLSTLAVIGGWGRRSRRRYDNGDADTAVKPDHDVVAPP